LALYKSFTYLLTYLTLVCAFLRLVASHAYAYIHANIRINTKTTLTPY